MNVKNLNLFLLICGPASAYSFSGSALIKYRHNKNGAGDTKKHSFLAIPTTKRNNGVRSKLHRKNQELNLSISDDFYLFPSIPLNAPKDKKLCLSKLVKILQIVSLSCAIVLTTMAQKPIATAADYGSLSVEQKSVAEAWRIVDNSFIDRTFNNQDWFKLRQNLVKKKYKNMDEARISISEMVGSLGDKYTRYLPPDKYESIVNSATGTLAGVGVQLGKSPDGRVEASDVEEISPAKAGGIRPRDIFVEVNGSNVEKSSLDEVAEAVRGPIGSKVALVMERNEKKMDFILVRESIKVTSVKSYLSEKSSIGKVGVIRIKSFSGTTASSVTDAIADLNKKGAKAFLIDLRGNPGGLLPGGVDTASLFLGNNVPIVFVVNKLGVVDSQSTFTAGPELEKPVVIFVDQNTASASEVFTAALKENKRATIAGSQTFGKGIVQTIRELSNGNGGVAVTVARYETPLHNDINKQGISVDVNIDDCTEPDAVVCIPSSAFHAPQI